MGTSGTASSQVSSPANGSLTAGGSPKATSEVQCADVDVAPAASPVAVQPSSRGFSDRPPRAMLSGQLDAASGTCLADEESASDGPGLFESAWEQSTGECDVEGMSEGEWVCSAVGRDGDGEGGGGCDVEREPVTAAGGGVSPGGAVMVGSISERMSSSLAAGALQGSW